MNKREAEIKEFEEALEKAFTGVRNLTHKYDLRPALLKKLEELQNHFLEDGKAAIRGREESP